MWSIQAMLVFIFFALFNNFNYIQYVDSATVTPVNPVTAPTVPGTQVPGYPTTGPYTPTNVLEVTTKLANAIGEAVQSILHYKKNSVSSIFSLVSNSLRNVTDPTQSLPTAPGAVAGQQPTPPIFNFPPAATPTFPPAATPFPPATTPTFPPGQQAAVPPVLQAPVAVAPVAPAPGVVAPVATTPIR